MKTKDKIKGMFWHCHHNRLCEYVWDYQERVDYIKKEKPKNEIETRLRLFKKIKGELPKELIEISKEYEEARGEYEEARREYEEALKKYGEALKKCEEALKKCEEALKKCEEALKKCEEAWKKCEEVCETYKQLLEDLHKKECGCKEWDGKELIFN